MQAQDPVARSPVDTCDMLRESRLASAGRMQFFPLLYLSLLVALSACGRVNYESDPTDNDVYQDEVLSDAPIMYWRLGEEVPPVANDLSGNGFVGEYQVVGLGETGAIARDSDTAVRIEPDNQSQVSAGDAFGFEGNQPFSAELWVKPGLSGACLMGKVNWNEDLTVYQGWFLFFNNESDTVTMRRAGSNISGPATLSTTKWSHIVATYDGITAYVYVNGEEIAKRLSPKAITPIIEPFLVGRMDNWQDYEGLVDEIALYDYLLAPSRINRHYVAGLTGR